MDTHEQAQVFDFADTQFHWKSGSILTEPHRFALGANDSGLSSFEITGDICIVFVAVRRGHKEFDVLARKFARGVSKHSGGSRIGVDNDSPPVDRNDGVR